MGLFPDNAVGTPGYDGIIPFEKATVAEILAGERLQYLRPGKMAYYANRRLSPAPDHLTVGLLVADLIISMAIHSGKL